MKRMLLATVATALLLAGCTNGGGDAARETAEPVRDADRTVDVTMTDNAFEPDRLNASVGETVAFRFRNEGRIVHDAFIGDEEAQADHEEDMRMGHGHGEGADAITVDPGGSGELVHRFTAAGTLEIGCHQPGHYAGGMKIDVRVR